MQLSSAGVLTIGCLMLLPIPASGQNGGDSAKATMQEMDRRALQLNGLGGDNQKKNESKRIQALMDQVTEDFQRILKLHNEMVRAIATNNSFNYQFISNAAEEIKKRATRLQSALRLQKPEPGEQNGKLVRDVEVMETRDGLIVLCARIESFVRNPIIETPGTVDAQQLDKARRDLQSVVDLSGALKKAADRRKPSK
jgi:hypothetical protein